MAKPTFIVDPQRSDGTRYIDCLPHQATSWVVKKVTKNFGRVKYTTKKVISRHQTRTQAEGEAHSMTMNAAGPRRRYVLGKRMEKQA